MKRPRISDSIDHISAEALSRSSARAIPQRALLMVVRGMILARAFPVAIAERWVTVNQDMKALALHCPDVDNFLLIAMRAWETRVLAAVERSTHGTCRLSSGVLEGIVLPIPPLAEQRRIVAKVDELMALCDRLESQQQRRTEMRTRLNRSMLHHLTEASDEAKLAASWEHLRKNFHLLYDVPETVGDLRNAVLNLAMRGKLVSQRQGDAAVQALVERIAAEKEQAHADDRIRKPRSIRSISDDELPFDVPNTWKWVRWAEIATDVQYGYTASADLSITKVRLVRITDIQNGRVDWETVPGCAIEARDVPTYQLREGDLLIARTGGTIGKSYLVPPPTVTAVFASYLIRMTPAPLMNPRYVFTFARSPIYWQQLLARSAGTGQPNVNGTSLSELLVPVPPIDEQGRIVSKVDELMGLCDALEMRLTEVRGSADQLSTSVLRRLTVV